MLDTIQRDSVISFPMLGNLRLNPPSYFTIFGRPIYFYGVIIGLAFLLGILCNWMVCLAVWMATGARNTIGKIFAIWFCIGLFVLSGFEHSVANMYFIPAGIMAAGNDAFVQLAV